MRIKERCSDESKIFIFLSAINTMQYKTKRKFIVSVSLALLLLLYLFKNYSSSVRVVSVIFGLAIFYFIDHAFAVQFRLRHYIYMFVVLLFGIMLSPLYYLSEIYDKVLHLLMPILGCTIVFFSVDKLKLEFKWKLLLTLTSLISILVILEIGEYLFDIFLDLKLQGVYIRDISGLQKYNLVLDKIDDTMIDLILGVLGCGIFSVGKLIFYYYKKV